MAVKCHKKRSGAARPASKLSLLVGLAGSFSSSSSSSGPGEGSAWSPTQRSPTQRSPRSFALDGAVGLGIVAAMNSIPSPAASQYGSATVAKTASAAPVRRSAPIPIVAARPASAGVPRPQCWSEEEDMDELSESYTCVTTRVGGDAVRRRVYLDVDVVGPGDQWGSWFGLFSGSPPAGKPAPLPVADFLSRCFRCSKRLHGLDVFMYGGDKAFCSDECRCPQMAGDGRRSEQLVAGALKPFDYSLSPCSTPPLLLFPSGVAAA